MFELFAVMVLFTCVLGGIFLLRIFFGLGIFAVKLLFVLAFVVFLPIIIPLAVIAGLVAVPLIMFLGALMLVLCGLKLIF